MKPFMGYMVQGIDDEWQMQNLFVEFSHFKGKHTSENIKTHYDKVCSEFELESKVFKIITDQAANMVKAFREVPEIEGAETDEITKIVRNLLFERRRLDNDERQQRLRSELEAEIDSMNNGAVTNNAIPTKKIIREQILDDFDMIDYTESIESSEDEEDNDDQNNLTLNDAEDFEAFTSERSNICFIIILILK
jgi:hypothetical protein